MTNFFRPLSVASAVLLCALLAGCSTFETRSQEKSAVFASLTPEQRDKLQHGIVGIGDTPDMVYIALGAPDEKSETTTAGGRSTVWIYNSYHEDYEGNFQSGFHRILLYDAVHNRYRVYFEPVYTDVYSQHTEENIRITFRDDKVVEIEQPKHS